VRVLTACASALAITAIISAPVHAQGTSSTQPPPVRPGTPKMPKTLKVPETFEGLFAERDARARAAVGYLRCLQGTINALRGGALGNVPTSWSIACVEQGREWRGVFGELGETGIDVRLQLAFRGERPSLTRDPVDTARVNGTARALLRGLAAPMPGSGKYEFTPVPLPQGTFLEVWFLPVPTNPGRPIVGGDSLIQMTPDGVRELGHARSTPPIRLLTPPANAQSWTVPSLEERIPTVSELMAAYLALDAVSEVKIKTRQYESTISRSAKGWTHRQPM
jgi:hypothetical protein